MGVNGRRFRSRPVALPRKNRNFRANWISLAGCAVPMTPNFGPLMAAAGASKLVSFMILKNSARNCRLYFRSPRKLFLNIEGSMLFVPF